MILKKPFDILEVKQIALALIKKWNLTKKARYYEEELKKKIKKQTEIIESMFEFANKINSLGNLDDILDCIINTVIKFINVKRISIMLMDENGKYLRVVKHIAEKVTGDINHLFIQCLEIAPNFTLWDDYVGIEIRKLLKRYGKSI